MRVVLAVSYEKPIFVAGIWNVLFLVLATCVMDQGEFLWTAVLAMIVFWISVLMATLRRPLKPTGADLLWIRIGYPVTLTILYFLRTAG